MSTHWTYEPVDPSSDLEQGDILSPSEALREIFKEVHPHFSDEKYLGFLVATQSCDLVRRDNSCKANYISLAAIRPLSTVVPRLISAACPEIAPGVFPQGQKYSAKQLLHRIFNQNEQSLGLFFLFQDADSGIGENAVAFLRVTVALKQHHYQQLQNARVGRLNSEFRAKLGWLLGNLFSRPATRDWSDMPGGQARLDELVSGCLEQEGSRPVRWVREDVIEQAARRGVDLARATDDELRRLEPPPVHEIAIEQIARQLQKVAPDLPEATLEKFCKRLRNDGTFLGAFRRRLL